MKIDYNNVSVEIHDKSKVQKILDVVFSNSAERTEPVVHKRRHPRKYARYTDQDDRQIQHMLDQNMPITRMAKLLGRSYGALAQHVAIMKASKSPETVSA